MAAHRLAEAAVVVVDLLVGGGAPPAIDRLWVEVLFQLDEHLEGVDQGPRSHVQHLLLLAHRQP